MLANELTEVVTDCSPAIVPVGRRREFPGLSMRGLRRFSEGTDFLDRANADSVGFPQRSVDSASFSNTHFGPVDKEGHIGGIGVAISNKAFARPRSIDSGLERPALYRRIAEWMNRLNVDAGAPVATCQVHESRMGNVPSAV
jgi:hypothetical protein